MWTVKEHDSYGFLKLEVRGRTFVVQGNWDDKGRIENFIELCIAEAFQEQADIHMEGWTE